MRLRYSEEALADLEQILDFITQDSPVRALSFIEKLKAKIELLTIFPALGVSCRSKRIAEDCRVMIFESYLIFYTITIDDITVLSIINSAKDYTKE